MLQAHPADVETVLGKYRTGDWNGARTFLKQTVGTSYDAGFATWLTTACATNGCGPLPEAPSIPLCTISDPRQFDKNCRRDNLAATSGNYSYHFVYLPAGVKQLTITSGGGAGNADLYYGGGSWATTSGYQAKSTKRGQQRNPDARRTCGVGGRSRPRSTRESQQVRVTSWTTGVAARGYAATPKVPRTVEPHDAVPAGARTSRVEAVKRTGLTCVRGAAAPTTSTDRVVRSSLAAGCGLPGEGGPASATFP